MSLEDIQWAGAPFDRQTSDIALRSSDAIHFRVHKLILADASSVFADVFANARPSAFSVLRTGDEQVDGLPLVNLSETGNVLRCLLQLYYGPSIKALTFPIADICGANLAARKYLMEPAICETKRMVRSLCDPENAIQVYAAAAKYGLAEEMQYAAQASLSIPVNFTDSAELAEISGSQAFKLLRYRQKCVEAARSVVTIDNTRQEEFPRRSDWAQKAGRGLYGDDRERRTLCAGGVYASDKFIEYLGAVGVALGERPHPDVVHEDSLQRHLFALAIFPRLTRWKTLADTMNWKSEVDDFQLDLTNAIESAISKVRNYQ
jgi:hypothetical protein